MANYGYINLPKRIGKREFKEALEKAVSDWFGDRLVVKDTTWENEGPVWMVQLPDSGCTDIPTARGCAKQMWEPLGFTVALQRHGRVITFRHGLNSWEHWAQGCIEEQLAEAFGVGIHYDATDKTYKPGVKRYRCRRTFGKYMARNFKKPLSPENQAYLNRVFRVQTPPGWW